ncbi:OadG family transporter subunit [Pseudidiomarina homiensis]|uniref:Probable oxaloacetate decarboxylase gamma chain n=1 Tax=Pseudidiomarina homiensis TaxID=364198 RepID=A0A432Y2X0_9GAMM|nr:OadG family transporter subunit [Pseudidiomarina homiensis]RUO55308.1 oxaloacetate decarboxylase [Pseudidiomarina homiensis]
MQQQLSEAFTIMLTGMITVFVFLTLLLLAMGLLRRFAATDETAPAQAPQQAPQAKTQATDAQRVAAITAAVHAYRRDHQ